MNDDDAEDDDDNTQEADNGNDRDNEFCGKYYSQCEYYPNSNLNLFLSSKTSKNTFNSHINISIKPILKFWKPQTCWT